jgi:hypothetical protein
MRDPSGTPTVRIAREALTLATILDFLEQGNLDDLREVVVRRLMCLREYNSKVRGPRSSPDDWVLPSMLESRTTFRGGTNVPANLLAAHVAQLKRLVEASR